MQNKSFDKNKGYMCADKRVVIVSDDPELITLLRLNLPELGCEVIFTGNYDESLLHLLIDENPDILIIDAKMPTLEGINFALGIRQVFQIPIIFVTTWGTPKGMIRTIGFDRWWFYLTKPCAITALLGQLDGLSQASDTRA
ncbi:response regulator transcription factor [Chloroflexota bacterium]